MNYHQNNNFSSFSEDGTPRLTKTLWLTILQNTEERKRITRNFSANFSRLVSQDPRTPVELTRALHISKSTMDRWKEGGVKPQYQKLLEVADCFSVTLKDLIADPEAESHQTN